MLGELNCKSHEEQLNDVPLPLRNVGRQECGTQIGYICKRLFTANTEFDPQALARKLLHLLDSANMPGQVRLFTESSLALVALERSLFQDDAFDMLFQVSNL